MQQEFHCFNRSIQEASYLTESMSGHWLVSSYMQLLNTNRTVRVTHDIEVQPVTGAPSPPSINYCSPSQIVLTTSRRKIAKQMLHKFTNCAECILGDTMQLSSLAICLGDRETWRDVHACSTQCCFS